MQVEPQVHFGSGLASAVFSQADAVGDHFHNGAIDRVNPALETVQGADGSSTRSKAQLDVLKILPNRPMKHFNEVSRTHFVCVRKDVARGR